MLEGDKLAKWTEGPCDNWLVTVRTPALLCATALSDIHTVRLRNGRILDVLHSLSHFHVLLSLLIISR